MAQRLSQYVRFRVQWGNRLSNATTLSVATVVPCGYLLLGDAQLRMSDDYAAINCGVSIAILLIGVFDMHSSLGKAKDFAAAGPMTDVVKVGDGEFTREHVVRSYIATMVLWLLTCSGLAMSLILMILWAAIDGHGPARVIAGGSMGMTGFGLGVVLLAAMDKLLEAAQGLFDVLPEPEEPEATPDAPAGA